MKSDRETKHTEHHHPIPVDITKISMGSNKNPIGDWNRLADHTYINDAPMRELASSPKATGEIFDQKLNESIEPFLTKHLLGRMPKDKITDEMKTWLTRSAHQTSLLGFISYPIMSYLSEKKYNPPTKDMVLTHRFIATSTGFEVEEHYIQTKIIKSDLTKTYEPEKPHKAVIDAKATLAIDFTEFDPKHGPKITVKEGAYMTYGHKKLKTIFGIEEHSQAYHFFKNSAKKLSLALQFTSNKDKLPAPKK